MGKILGILFVIALFFVLFLPRQIPKLLRRLGRSVRRFGQVGKEIVSGEEQPDSPLARYEVKAGKIVLQKVMMTTRLSEDMPRQEHVAAIGARVAAGAARKEIPYAIRLTEDPEPNAFAVPGGTVFVTRGLLHLCDENTDALACVLGHEIAHIDRRHAVLNLTAKAALKTVNLLSLGRMAILRHMAGSIEELLVKGYHQDHEFEADRVGADLARAAGFDPRGFTFVLRRLLELDPEKGSPLAEVFQYFRSHPPLVERIARLEGRYGR